MPFPTTRSFHHAHFARLALDLLVCCSAKFQQYGLCLLQNFVTRYSNRTRLAAAGVIVALCAHIEHWFDVQMADVVAAKSPQSRLPPDYLFLFSIVGTASAPRVLSVILALHGRANALTLAQMDASDN